MCGPFGGPNLGPRDDLTEMDVDGCLMLEWPRQLGVVPFAPDPWSRAEGMRSERSRKRRRWKTWRIFRTGFSPKLGALYKSLHMCNYVFVNGIYSFYIGLLNGQTCLMRPLATAAGAGSLSSLIVALAGELLRSPVPVAPPELCSLIPPLPTVWVLDYPSLLLGICVGLLLGPAIDLVIIIRLSWGQFVRARLGSPPRGPLYRVLG